MGNEVTGTFTAEKDGTIVIKEGDTSVRYVKESDLLAIKGSREATEKRVKDAEATHAASLESVKNEAESTRQKVLLAEAKVSNLEEQIAKDGNSKAELEKLKIELVAAKKSGEELGSKALEYRRAVIVTTYGIPVATVEKKTMTELDHFEEALKAVLGKGGVGNYAAGGGSGGVSLQGKSPIELARLAYDLKK
jgi:Asp-tRNA(Asn)/Glu-tRNA(Gln) amidotransferase B subunit